MIQFLIAILLGLVAPADNTENNTPDNEVIITTTNSSGGENGQLPTPRPKG
ncbi:hypothetical protein [Pedobacter glucosidilyticus]|uniref:hypothetical protein n=1 Tax=Pedobacter glucosidilyticus TaxID=1122941 RepID=UPI0026F0D4FB|nr:hypothetical protein [Pedobacter glucosidilyticus]